MQSRFDRETEFKGRDGAGGAPLVPPPSADPTQKAFTRATASAPSTLSKHFPNVSRALTMGLPGSSGGPA